MLTQRATHAWLILHVAQATDANVLHVHSTAAKGLGTSNDIRQGASCMLTLGPADMTGQDLAVQDSSKVPYSTLIAL